MTKRNKKDFAVVSALFLTTAALIGCGSKKDFGNKYVVNIWNFKGGFGAEWISNVIDEYETLHKDTEYGDKVGIHFEVTNNKKEFNASDLVTYDMFFLESANYSDFVASNAIEDITEAVTEDNPYEPGKALLDKFTESQKSFYKTQGNKYFGVPHYSGTYGITYDSKLFREKGFYYAKGHDPVDPQGSVLQYFTDDMDNLAPGPDGIEGTDDDGLPVTFQEFYTLCDRMLIEDIYPLEFAGDSNQGGYISAFTTSLMNNLMGGDEALINYYFNGTASKMVKLDASGKFQVDANGNAILEESPVAITNDKGYDIYRSEGRFNAVKFISNVFQNKRYNPHIEGDHSYTAAEDEFIMGEKLGGTASVNRSGMLIDGSWWQSEAKSTFEAMDKKYGNQGVMDRDFRFMPLPRAQESDPYYQTYTDTLNALQCVRKGVSTQTKEICMDFLQFINTDEQLVKFSQKTNTTRALNYTMTDDEMSLMSPYGRSLFKYKTNANTKIVYPISNTKQFVNGMSGFFTSQYQFKSKDRNFVTNWFGSGIYDAGTICTGIYSYFKDAWKTL